MRRSAVALFLASAGAGLLVSTHLRWFFDRPDLTSPQAFRHYLAEWLIGSALIVGPLLLSTRRKKR